jgi:hypothetical protein
MRTSSHLLQILTAARQIIDASDRQTPPEDMVVCLCQRWQPRSKPQPEPGYVWLPSPPYRSVQPSFAARLLACRSRSDLFFIEGVHVNQLLEEANRVPEHCPGKKFPGFWQVRRNLVVRLDAYKPYSSSNPEKKQGIGISGCMKKL